MHKSDFSCFANVPPPNKKSNKHQEHAMQHFFSQQGTLEAAAQGGHHTWIEFTQTLRHMLSDALAKCKPYSPVTSSSIATVPTASLVVSTTTATSCHQQQSLLNNPNNNCFPMVSSSVSTLSPVYQVGNASEAHVQTPFFGSDFFDSAPPSSHVSSSDLVQLDNTNDMSSFFNNDSMLTMLTLNNNVPTLPCSSSTLSNELQSPTSTIYTSLSCTSSSGSSNGFHSPSVNYESIGNGMVPYSQLQLQQQVQHQSQNSSMRCSRGNLSIAKPSTASLCNTNTLAPSPAPLSITTYPVPADMQRFEIKNARNSSYEALEQVGRLYSLPYKFIIRLTLGLHVKASQLEFYFIRESDKKNLNKSIKIVSKKKQKKIQQTVAVARSSKKQCKYDSLSEDDCDNYAAEASNADEITAKVSSKATTHQLEFIMYFTTHSHQHENSKFSLRIDNGATGKTIFTMAPRIIYSRRRRGKRIGQGNSSNE